MTWEGEMFLADSITIPVVESTTNYSEYLSKLGIIFNLNFSYELGPAEVPLAFEIYDMEQTGIIHLLPNKPI